MVRNKGKIALAVLCFNILTGVTTYAKELTLEELINVMQSNSYSKQSAEINQKQLDVQEKSIDLDGKNKIVLNSNANIYSNNDYGQSTITTAVTYDIFNYRNIHNFDTNKTSNIIGVSKDLKDFFVSEKDYNKRIISYTRETTKITDLQTINTDVIALIDLYVSYLNSKEEKRVNEELVNTYKVDKNVKKTAYNVGLGSLYDSELSKVNFENASNNIMFYDYKMKNIIEGKKIEFFFQIVGAILDKEGLAVNVYYPEKKKDISLKVSRNTIENYIRLLIGSSDEETLYDQLTSKSDAKVEQYYPNGKIKSRITLVNGFYINQQEYDEKGKLFYQSKANETALKEFYGNGKIKLELDIELHQKC